MDGESGEIKDDVQAETYPRQIEALGGMAEETREAPDKETQYHLSVAQYISSIGSLTKLKQPQKALEQCNEALEIYPQHPKLLERKVKILCQQHKFQDAHRLVEDWLKSDPNNAVAKKELKKLKIILSAVEDQDSDEEEEDPASLSQDIVDVGIETADTEGTKSNTLPTNSLSFGSANTSAFKLFNKAAAEHIKNEDLSGQFFPRIAQNPVFAHKHELDGQSKGQRETSNTEDQQSWCYRAPPRGLASEEYVLCKRFLETGRCTFGEKCTMAHSEAELDEWNHRYAVRKQQLQQSQGTRAQGGTVIEQLVEKFMSPEHPKLVVVENLDLVKIHVNSDLKVNMTTKKCTNAWTFTVTSKMCLHCVALMLDTNRSYFHVSSISVGPRKTQKYQNLENMCQEWVNQDIQGKGQGEYVYRVKVVFKTDIYGTFRQSIVFDFGVDAILMREVQVESAPASDAEKVRKEITLTEAHRWNEKTVQLVNFDPRPASHSEAEEALMAKYQLPRPDKFCQPETVMHSLSKENYRLWMHEMLYIEEMEQVGYISRFNVTTSLQLVNRFLLMPSTLSTAKYAHDGELFARMKLEDDLSEDSMGGRLVLQSSHVAWVAEAKKEKPEKVYEAVIEDKGKNFIFMRLSKACVEELGLSCDQEFNAQIQFQLNRLPMCERHYAVDRLPTLDIVFPQLNSMPAKLALDDSDLQDPNEAKRLNEKQKDAVRLILAKSDVKLPPLLIVGPFGTGKTFTMAQAAKQVLKEEGTRILICTHSNSAADLYIKEFLHSYVDEEDHAEARPLRVMYKFRWIQTVPEVVLDYTLLEREGPQAGTFRPPTPKDVMAHRVIIATLSSARYLADLKLPEDAFSHIFIDEAAQSLESETLIPLSVAHENTRIVFAGDHMQMSPEVYSDFTRQQGFHTSLLERLHELYPKECVYKVMLCENYRAHAAIIDFTSELFYDNKLISSGNIVAHDQFYPLTFFAAKGEEIQHENNTGFYNMSEVYEIVERVDELKKKWPEAWGAFDNNGVSIVAPYIDQVARIRSELRKRKLFNINVERVLNVQGKQYRVIILSITRTRLTCRSDPTVEEITDFGFLSNIKLLNTAITRAQSLVVVVGDPVSVCLVGKCRKIWEYFLEICHYNDSLHGISWVPLREQLDRAELTKSFVLNPLAPEFVPSRLYHSPHAPQHAEHGLLLQGGIGAGGGFPPHPHSHPHFAGYPAGYGMVPGQPFPQMIPSMYQPPVYFPYNPGLLPAMYYPQSTFGRGFIPSKQMFGRYMTPSGSSTAGYPYARSLGPVLDGLQRIVEMPRAAGLRHPRGGGRHSAYYPRGGALHGFSPSYHQPLLHPPAGGYLYQLQEDPRAMTFASSPAGIPHPFLANPPQAFRAPHGTAYSGMPRHHHQLFTGPSSSAYQPYPGYPHGAPSPQSLLKGAAGLTRERSDTADSGGSAGRMSDSPSSGIQLLPNVKHVPAHLFSRPESDSDPHQRLNSSPVGGIGIPTSQHLRREGERVSAVSQRPYSPANYTSDRSLVSDGHSISRSFSPANFLKEKTSSGDEGPSRGGSFSPATYGMEDRRSSGEEVSSSHHSSHDRSMSLSPPSPATTRALPQAPVQHSAFKMVSAFRQDAIASNGGGDGDEIGGLNNRRRPNLKLHTGFSRQFSDDLPTPTVITNVFQMIDDNIEESQGEEGASSSSPLPALDDRRRGQKPELKLKMSVAQRLQRRQATDDSDVSSSSATPPSGEEPLPSYASMVTRLSDQGREIMTAEDATHLDLQTPRTPKGFITPGTEVGEVDPFGILKSLNIGSTHQ
ncbi:hypothetical protein RRG08_063685 [Elysia crispata]|uniref:C3H1-type domain-containing protein n=1 Tax=Elysia crispata TaxID=231223 RepID=A0AAE0ZAB2_9GAST|nr:hypothetical protein RRG08_063685 [Elysia crispata]